MKSISLHSMNNLEKHNKFIVIFNDHFLINRLLSDDKGAHGLLDDEDQAQCRQVLHLGCVQVRLDIILKPEKTLFVFESS